jgi:hypothetical protein
LQKIFTPTLYTPPGNIASFYMPTAYTVMVVNQPPLGCIPAMLTLYGGPKAKYDKYGCLSDLNAITDAHNRLLNEKVVALRAKYPERLILYADAHGVYTDILEHPESYSKHRIPEP